MADHGWTFKSGDGVIPDPLFDAEYMYQIYTHADADYSGRVTVPILWDKQERSVVPVAPELDLWAPHDRA